VQGHNAILVLVCVMKITRA